MFHFLAQKQSHHEMSQSNISNDSHLTLNQTIPEAFIHHAKRLDNRPPPPPPRFFEPCTSTCHYFQSILVFSFIQMHLIYNLKIINLPPPPTLYFYVSLFLVSP